MAKISVKLKLDPRLKSAKTMFDKRFQERVGLQTVLMMREMIAIGLSPVKGFGRFVAYSAQRKANDVKTFAATQAKNKQGFYRKLSSKTAKSSSLYPNSVRSKYPGKQTRPVNLSLEGSFVETINFDASDGKVEVGHIDASQRTRNLFEAHNEGLNTKMQVPQRKYLPNKRGDDFVVSIMRMIKDLYQQRIKQIIKKG